MEIVGIGIDIIEVQKIARAITRTEKFLKKIYQEEEISLSSRGKFKSEELAGRFAAKEAFLKAIKTGWRKGIKFRDITVLNESSGAPYIILDGRAKEIAQELRVKEILVSISHTKKLATAIVVLTK